MNMLLKAISLFFFCVALTDADPVSIKKVLKPDDGDWENLILNPGFESVEEDSSWVGWQEGFHLETAVARTGKRSARCSSDDGKIQYGVYQIVELDQQVPTPIIAEIRSKAEKVSGTPDSGYSLYIDIVYQDGTPLWGRNAPFECGTHGWQRRRVTIVPDKPIKTVNVYGLFRGHTGTAWFDDFLLVQMVLPQGAHRFDSVPVAGVSHGRRERQKELTLRTGDGFSLALDRNTGEVVTETGRGGFFVRDFSSQSDFRQPAGRARRTRSGASWKAKDKQLRLQFEARYTVNGNCIRVDGEVRDLSRSDRAVTVYFTLPADGDGWEWSSDLRNDVTVEAGREYIHGVQIGAGATGKMSLYPLTALSGPDRGVGIALPLNVPRLARLAYNSGSRELYAAFDLGLAQDTKNFPSRASFSFVLYAFEPRWRMRAALQKYYELFPESFVKRVKREGTWMPFTDISTIPDFEDFGFAFKEGNNSVHFDEKNGIDSFVYIEPMSHWLPIPEKTQRTYEGALATLRSDADGTRGSWRKRHALATLNSAFHRPDGRYALSIRKAPWCDGALILLNPSPRISSRRKSQDTKAHLNSETVDNAFQAAKSALESWRPFGRGFEIDRRITRSGKLAIKCSNPRPGDSSGAVQTVVLDQSAPKPLRLTAWSKSKKATGKKDTHYAIYVDVTHTDGTKQWSIVSEFPTGRFDWTRTERIFEPVKPVARASFHLLFRRTHTGTVWFDDIFFGEADSDKNLLKNPGFETLSQAELDGVYIDSLEMGATSLNYRREHWSDTETPLVFDSEGRPCQMMIFNTCEFAEDLADQMHGRGKLMFANAVPLRFPFAAHFLDVMGVEVNWMRGPEFTPAPDSRMSYWRVMCHQKPYCLLMNTNYERLTHAYVEQYMKRCLFYAIFPGMFDEDAASKDPYWASSKKWYDRDRDLFKRYVPLIQALAKAGWEPVTGARTNDDQVYAERFGSITRGRLFLTLMNDSREDRDVELTLDSKALGLPPLVRFEDVFQDRELESEKGHGAILIKSHLKAQDVMMIEVKR